MDGHLTIEQIKLVEDNIKLAKFFAWKFFKSYKRYKLDIDECISIANVALAKAAKDFKEEKGFKFSTFYAKVSFNLLYKELISRNSQLMGSCKGRERGDYQIAISTNTLLGDTEKFSIEDTLRARDEDIDSKILIKEILYKCEDENHKKILKLFYQGYTQIEIGKVMGISQVQVSRIMKKFKYLVDKQIQYKTARTSKVENPSIEIRKSSDEDIKEESDINLFINEEKKYKILELHGKGFNRLTLSEWSNIPLPMINEIIEKGPRQRA